MKLTKRQLYDYRDPSRAEMILTKAIHHLWSLRRRKACTYEEWRDTGTALDVLAEAKVQVKAEIKKKNAASFNSWIAREVRQ